MTGDRSGGERPPSAPTTLSKRDARKERLAAELRANIAKRKRQTVARTANSEPASKNPSRSSR